MTLLLYAMVPSSNRRVPVVLRFGRLAPGSASVGRPLHALQIDAFFVHLPKRREVAKPPNLFDDQVCNVVDFFFRVEATETKSNAGVGELISDAERTKNVARLQARR